MRITEKLRREQRQLFERLRKLRKFRRTDLYESLSSDERWWIRRQQSAMEEYNLCLLKRLDILEKGEP